MSKDHYASNKRVREKKKNCRQIKRVCVLCLLERCLLITIEFRTVLYLHIEAPVNRFTN
jgi:hypothetical protein